MKKRLYMAALILVFFLAEQTLVPLIRINGNGPELLLLLPVFFGFFNGPLSGIFVGLFAGILADVYGSVPMGTSALLFVLFGYLSGRLLQNVEQEEFFFPVILTFLSAFVYEFAMWFALYVMKNDIQFHFFLIRKILPISLYTLLFGIALYYPLRALNTKMKAGEAAGERL